MKPQLRRAMVPHYLYVAPQHALRLARTKCFHRRFLRREPSREVRRRVAAACCVLDLPIREDTPQKAIAVAFDRRLDARDVGRIQANADNICRHDVTKA